MKTVLVPLAPTASPLQVLDVEVRVGGTAACGCQGQQRRRFWGRPWVGGVSRDISPGGEAVGSTLKQACAIALASLLWPGLYPDFPALLQILCAT